ncbi:hypothetical protein F511_43264 [Dorcoceras hygrometricum]|uniref:Uncharacterized protein n=1 Tax=Dorcoceras hygrometricum TaxID=472368 RepID=A0A2Z7ANN4_9LAMI|nr:hypothetical protein F511_43264 [Dorcoceras hygrometricum]
MASSYYTNTLHVNFASVLAMDDPGMVSMFQALMAYVLEGFLGCPAVIYEAALVDFFENASVRDGLTDLTEIPKDLVFDARSIVSFSGEPVSMSGKKKEMKFEYRLLCDIMAKTISPPQMSQQQLSSQRFKPRGIHFKKNSGLVLLVPTVLVEVVRGGYSQSHFLEPQQARVHAMTREQASDALGGVIAGTLGGVIGGTWLRPVPRGNRHFTVGGGRLRKSGPRPEGRLLRQPALEGLTRSARMETP